MVDDQRVSRQHPDDRGRLSPPGRRTARTVRLKLSGTLCLAAAVPLIRWLHSLSRGAGNAGLRCLSAGDLPFGSGEPVPTPSTLRREAVRSRGRRLVAEAIRPKPVAGVPLSFRIGTSPSGRRAPPILRVPSHPRTARNRLRDSGQVIFRSLPSRLPCRFRRHPVARPSRGRTLGRSVGLSSLTPQG